MPRLLSVNVGLPREVTWHDKTVQTSVWKSPVGGRRMVRRLKVQGDAQGDLAAHGGEHHAVFDYQMDSYHYWERFLCRSDFTFGQFGENLTVEGLPDNAGCIGDRYRIGGAAVEVSCAVHNTYTGRGRSVLKLLDRLLHISSTAELEQFELPDGMRMENSAKEWQIARLK